MFGGSQECALQPDPHCVFANPASLRQADFDAFGRLGIPEELLVQAHVQRVTDREAREKYGITGPVSNDMSGIVFPYFSLACLPCAASLSASLRLHPRIVGENSPSRNQS